MSFIKKLFRKNITLKNIFTLISGTVAAQLIAIITQPILRRIIPAEDFGIFAVYMSLVGIITVVVCLRYDISIVLPDKKSKAENLVIGGMLITFIISSLIGFSLYFFKPYFVLWLNIPNNYYSWFYFLPFSVFFAGSYSILNNWLIRHKAFRKSSENKIVRRSTEAVSQFTFGSFGQGFGLFLGELIGSFANFLMGILQVFKTGFSLKQINKISTKLALLEYKKFPLYNAIPALLNNAALLLPVIFINRLYNEEITAYYDLSRQILGLSLALISAAISQVYLQKLAEKRSLKQKLWPDILKAIKILGLLSVLGIIIIEFFGETLFSFIFGKEYVHSGTYAKIMVISFGLRFIVTPLSIAFISLEKLKLNAFWQFIYFALIMVLLSMDNLTIKQFLIRYVIIDLFAYLIYFILIIRIIKQHDTCIEIMVK